MIPLIAGCTRGAATSRQIMSSSSAGRPTDDSAAAPRAPTKPATALSAPRAIADQNEHLSSPKGQRYRSGVISSHPARSERSCPVFDRIPAAQVRRRFAPRQQLRLPAGRRSMCSRSTVEKQPSPAQQVVPFRMRSASSGATPAQIKQMHAVLSPAAGSPCYAVTAAQNTIVPPGQGSRRPGLVVRGDPIAANRTDACHGAVARHRAAARQARRPIRRRYSATQPNSSDSSARLSCSCTPR